MTSDKAEKETTIFLMCKFLKNLLEFKLVESRFSASRFLAMSVKKNN